MAIITKIIIANKIVANTETRFVSDVDDQRKVVKLIIQIIAIIVGLNILLILTSNFFRLTYKNKKMPFN